MISGIKINVKSYSPIPIRLLDQNNLMRTSNQKSTQKQGLIFLIISLLLAAYTKGSQGAHQLQLTPPDQLSESGKSRRIVDSKDCGPKCITCQNFQNTKYFCSRCKIGSFLNSTSKKCSSCTLPCTSCQDSPENCLSCDSGYRLAQNKGSVYKFCVIDWLSPLLLTAIFLVFLTLGLFTYLISRCLMNVKKASTLDVEEEQSLRNSLMHSDLTDLKISSNSVLKKSAGNKFTKKKSGGKRKGSKDISSPRFPNTKQGVPDYNNYEGKMSSVLEVESNSDEICTINHSLFKDSDLKKSAFVAKESTFSDFKPYSNMGPGGGIERSQVINRVDNRPKGVFSSNQPSQTSRDMTFGEQGLKTDNPYLKDKPSGGSSNGSSKFVISHSDTFGKLDS